MKNVLLDKGIILPSGEISKDKVNLVTGAITQPFAEMVWRHGNRKPLDRRTCYHEHPRRPGEAVQNHKNALWAYGLALFRGSRAYGRRPRRFGILHFFLYGRLWRSHTRPHSRRSRITHRTGGVSHFPQGRTGTPLFSCPLLRSRHGKALDLRGFADAVFSG